MIQVQAYSRLHFGFLNPFVGEPAVCRRFGGVGVMIAQPDLLLRVEPDSAWSAEGPLAERALMFAQRFAAASCRAEPIAHLPPRRLRIERAMPAHAGLGSGTQLALSVARALAVSWGLSCDLDTLANRVGRGLRSALGTHGFQHGGLLVEAGKNTSEGLAPLVARLPFPEMWRLVVALPHCPSSKIEKESIYNLYLEGGEIVGLHGEREKAAFARLMEGPAVLADTEALCRLVLLGLLPALVERDLDAFGEALYEFNTRVGETFAPVQGGIYASPRVTELVQFLRAQKIRGVGQSSWGPAVFAVVADEEQAEHLADQLRCRFTLPPSAVWTTPACNHGAILRSDPSESVSKKLRVKRKRRKQ